jgi:glutamine synthetase
VSANEVLEFAKKIDAKQLDLRFTDIPSLQHHVSYPINELDEGSFEDGFGMDGSSIHMLWPATVRRIDVPACVWDCRASLGGVLGPSRIAGTGGARCV